MKFLIRDDDACGFTQPNEIERVYKNIWDEIPICLSMTPYRVAEKAFKQYSQNGSMHKGVHENPELVDYIKGLLSTGKIEVSLHGYDHKWLGPIPEYAINDKSLVDKTRKGKEYLENLLDTSITTFTPPNNRISKWGIKALRINRLNLIGSPSFKLSARPYTWKVFHTFAIKKRFTQRFRIKYPFVTNPSGINEVANFSLGPKSHMDDLLKTLETVNKVNGVFVLATHYHAFHKKILSGQTIDYAFNKIIDQGRKLNNVEFIPYRKLWPK